MKHWPILLFGLLLLSGCRPPASAPRQEQISLWYWHSPFRVTESEGQMLARMGVERLFVRAGTISNDGKKLVLVMPQHYAENAPALPLTLVFPFDSGAVSHFDDFELEEMARGVGARIVAQMENAEKSGMTVEGVQLDMDCPTRLLPRYADFVRLMREREPRLKRTTFSTTALFSWLGSEGMNKLGAELDFIVPQAYEGETGLTLETSRPVSDPAMMSRLKHAERLPCPYYVGLPAYGRATLFSAQGNLVNIYRGLTPSQALRSPAFEMLEARAVDGRGREISRESDWCGEQFLILTATRPDSQGRGMGSSLLYSIPSADQLSRSLAEARKQAGSNCRGFIIFRYPEPEESLALALDAAAAVIAGHQIEPQITAHLESATDNFGVIESGTAPRSDFFVRLENTGSAGTMLAEDGIIVDITAPKGTFERASGRDALRFSFGAKDSEGVFRETGRDQADTVRFWLPGLAAHEKCALGPIRVLKSGSDQVKMSWVARRPSGFGILSGTR